MDRATFRQEIAGNLIPLPTPLDDDYRLDLTALRRLVRRLLDAGFRRGNGALLAGGAAGEFSTLEMDERKAVLETVLEEAAGAIAVVFGAQDTSTFRIVELARFAERAGAAGVQVGPTYYEPATPDDVFTLFQTVSDRAAIPLMAYNTWWTGTHADMGFDLTARLVDIANVGALKWSAPNHFQYEWVLREFAGRVAIIDNMVNEVYSHMMGAAGFVSHLPLAWPAWGLRLWDCLQRRDYGAALTLLRGFRMPYYRLSWKTFAYSGSEALFDKAILELIGLPCGPARPPARPLTAERKEEIRRMLCEAGVPGVLPAP